MKFHIKTYGCQMNARDSEMVAVLLRRQGHALVERENDAEVIIVNTCSVREKAEAKALGKLRLLVASRRERPGRIVGAMGCMVQRMQQALLRQVPGLDFAIGTHRLFTVPDVIETVRAGKRPLIDFREADQRRDLDTHAGQGVSAFINILFGCDRRCSYCVVPEVRGGEWSRSAVEIVEEARRLTRQGVKEITLLGQSVMSYGRRNPVWTGTGRSAWGFTEPLPRLLEAVSAIGGLERIRFTSGHPSGCTRELARAMTVLPPVCEQLHLPLQSGSDRILTLMRRGYTTDDYRSAVACLRSAVPQVVVTTDIIVGFPSETEADFEQTRALMDEIGFDNAFVFKYNPRPNTPAAELPDDVPAEEKMRRNQVLLTDQRRRVLAFNRRLIGRTQAVLVEGRSRRNPGRWSGRTRSNKMAIFNAAPGIGSGDIISITIERVTAQTLYGNVRQPILVHVGINAPT